MGEVAGGDLHIDRGASPRAEVHLREAPKHVAVAREPRRRDRWGEVDLHHLGASTRRAVLELDVDGQRRILLIDPNQHRQWSVNVGRRSQRGVERTEVAVMLAASVCTLTELLANVTSR